MSTRCQVKVICNGQSIMLYHHCDGYPEGVGYCLLKILKLIKDKRRSPFVINDMVKKGDFEITFFNHADIEYYYEIDFDKQIVSCAEVDCWEKTMEILRIIDLVYDKEKDVGVDEQPFSKEN